MEKPSLPRLPTQAIKTWFAIQLRAIKRLEKDDLDLQQAGQWPSSLKGLALLGILIAVLFASNWFLIGSLREQLEAAHAEQDQLFEDYQLRAFQAANLQAYQEQMQRMEAAFSDLLSKLPIDREVPRLLEDIHAQASQHNLEVQTLTLGNDQQRDFYTELPFEIRVQGRFHNLAGFVAGISSLDRIITLHDFTLTHTSREQQTGYLNLVAQARTYRYSEELYDEEAASGGQK